MSLLAVRPRGVSRSATARRVRIRRKRSENSLGVDLGFQVASPMLESHLAATYPTEGMVVGEWFPLRCSAQNQPVSNFGMALVGGQLGENPVMGFLTVV